MCIASGASSSTNSTISALLSGLDLVRSIYDEASIGSLGFRA